MNNPQSTKRDRVAEILRWLMFDRQEDIRQLADSLGYSVTVISEAEKAMLPISNKLLASIIAAHPRIDAHWVETGEGDMLTHADTSDARQYLANSTRFDRDLLARKLAIFGGVGEDEYRDYLSHFNAVYEMLRHDPTMTSPSIESVISSARLALSQLNKRI